MLSAPGDQEGFCWMPSSRKNTVNQAKFSDIEVQDTFISFCPNKWIGVLFVTAWLMKSVWLWGLFSHPVEVAGVGWWGGVGLRTAPPALVMFNKFGWLGCDTSGCFLTDILLGGLLVYWEGAGTLKPPLLQQKDPQPCLVDMDKQHHNVFYQGMQESGFLLLWMTFASLPI